MPESRTHKALQRIVAAATLSILGVNAAAESPWPQFRGPAGDGIVTDCEVPLKFSDSQNVTWKTELEGKGWSSPVVADGVIWLTNSIEVLPTEEERLEILKASGVEERKFKQLAVAKSIHLQLLALDLQSGNLLDTIELTTVEPPDPIHPLNSFASPTPVIDGDYIYCHFGTYGTHCIDRATKKTVWQRQLPLEHGVGPGSSPFIDGPRLVLIQDGMDRQYVTALDKLTGSTIWETDRPEMDAPTGDQKKAYCTPIKIVDPQGRPQLICMGSQWMVAYAPESGKEIWRVRHGKGFSVVPRPVYADGVVYFSTGFGKAQLWAVGVDGSGDVTKSHVKWTVLSGIPTKPSPLVHNGLIYVIGDSGIARCFDTKNGEEVWRKRIGGKFSASPLLVNDRIYLGSQEGLITVLSAGADSEMIAENQVSGQIMASPAVFDNMIILRTSEAVYRIQ
ncbi:MAG: serine/threonine protein kinase [Rhodopirellula sp. TMED11]|nr:MAG: serine/threonine protein kinase [Rhodopirellula sp. TMED11]